MRTIVEAAKLFALVFLGLCAMAGIIWAFSDQPGAQGFSFYLLWVCAGLIGIGGLLVLGSQSSGQLANDVAYDKITDAKVAGEIRKDGRRGSSLGMTLFFMGALAFGIAYLLHKAIDPAPGVLNEQTTLTR